jgi:hypothetical protein
MGHFDFEPTISVSCPSCGQDLEDLEACPRCKIVEEDPADDWEARLDDAMRERMAERSITSRLDLEAAEYETELARREERDRPPKKASAPDLPPDAGIPEAYPRGHAERLRELEIRKLPFEERWRIRLAEADARAEASRDLYPVDHPAGRSHGVGSSS